MVDATISRVRLHDLARLGRSGPDPAGGAGLHRACASPRRPLTEAPGFGKFSTAHRAARMGVNPRNPSEKVQIQASTVPKFSAGSTLKQAVKSGGAMGGSMGGSMGGGDSEGGGGGGGY